MGQEGGCPLSHEKMGRTARLHAVWIYEMIVNLSFSGEDGGCRFIGFIQTEGRLLDLGN